MFFQRSSSGWILASFAGLAGGGVACASAVLVAGCGVRTPLTDVLHVEPLAATDAGKDAAVVTVPGDAETPETPDAGVDAAATVSDAEADVALPTSNLGNVFLTSGAYQSGAVQTLKAQAAFYPSVPAAGCSVALVGGCKLETCGPSSATTSGLASAGSIAVSGGLYPLLLQPGLGNVYEPASDGGSLALWHGGEGLIVTSSGGQVPAFAANLTAPRQVSVLTPMPLLIPKTSALPFTWFGDSAGNVVIDLNTTNATGAYYLECSFDVGAGAGSLPAAALAALPGGAGVLTIGTASKSIVYAGGWQIDAFAQTNANGPDGLEYTGTMPIE
jgi:hypothetical protein